MTLVNPENENVREINVYGDWMNFKSSTIVETHERLVVQYEDGPIELKVTISADFNTVPEKYHEIFMNVMMSRYLGKVSFGDNPFSECRPIKKRKWYQFWKPKFTT
jgi:hypothetical protein